MNDSKCMGAKVYHYSKCATCRRVINDLNDKGIELELRDIFKERLSRDEIRKLLERANISAKEALRKRHRLYKEIIKKDYSDDEIIELMAKDPSLIERPIVVMDGKVFIKPDVRTLQ